MLLHAKAQVLFIYLLDYTFAKCRFCLGIDNNLSEFWNKMFVEFKLIDKSKAFVEEVEKSATSVGPNHTGEKNRGPNYTI